MRYREIAPGAEVRSFIDCYWILEHEASEPARVQRVVPDGRPELILNLGQPFESFQDGQWRVQPGCFLAGQITGPLLIRPNGKAKILGVRFLPHGAGQVFGLPMHELTDLAVPVADLSPRLARDLERSLESAGIPSIEAALLSFAGAEDCTVGEAVSQIVRDWGRRDVACLAAHLGISLRQLERRFESRVGLSPKLFSRMQRFQRVFQEIDEGRPNWVEAALACGYYDQAHLIRDFKDFSGQTPALLLAGADLARHFVRNPGVSDFYKTARQSAI
jgi:AraC-like DNA-binding protein